MVLGDGNHSYHKFFWSGHQSAIPLHRNPITTTLIATHNALYNINKNREQQVNVLLTCPQVLKMGILKV